MWAIPLFYIFFYIFTLNSWSFLFSLCLMEVNISYAKRCDTSYISINQKASSFLAVSFIIFEKRSEQDFPPFLKIGNFENECIFENKVFSGIYQPRTKLQVQLTKKVLISIHEWLNWSFINWSVINGHYRLTLSWHFSQTLLYELSGVCNAWKYFNLFMDHSEESHLSKI